MKTNHLPATRLGQDDEGRSSRGSSPDHHPHQIIAPASSLMGRTNTSELSAITLPSVVSDVNLSPTTGEMDMADSTTGVNSSANGQHHHLHGQALHDEAMLIAQQERSVASLPSLATTPERVNDEGQSLLHRGRGGGADHTQQDKLYRSFGTMEDVSGASMFVQAGNNKQGKAQHTTTSSGAKVANAEISLPAGDFPHTTAAGTPVDGKQSVLFSGLPISGYQNDAKANEAEAHHEMPKRRKSVRFSVIGNMFASVLGINPSSFDDSDDEAINNYGMAEDALGEESSEAGRKRGWSIIRNRQKSIVLYGRRLIQNDSKDEEEGYSNGAADGDDIGLSEHSAQRRDSDRKARQREKILQRANLAAERYEITIADCLLAIACYLGLSALAFSFFFEHWSVIDSAYFAVVTFTACGYGDLVPSTNGGRLFCTFFALGGCAFLGIALGILGDHMIKSEVEKRKRLEVQRQSKVMKSFVAQESSGGSERNLSRNSLRDSWGIATNRFSLVKFPALIIIVSCTTFISIKEGWNFIDGLFYTIVTACTIGYGDLAPTLESTRAVAVLFVPFSVACLGALLARIASAVINRRQQKFRDDLLHFELTPDLFEACDSSNDGRVDKAEYMTFMLLAMRAVDSELLDAISAQFDKLDITKTGDLCVQDLLEALEKNLHSPKKKLELHRYKQSLLAKGAIKKGLGKSTRFGSGGVSPCNKL